MKSQQSREKGTFVLRKMKGDTLEKNPDLMELSFKLRSKHKKELGQ